MTMGGNMGMKQGSGNGNRKIPKLCVTLSNAIIFCLIQIVTILASKSNIQNIIFFY